MSLWKCLRQAPVMSCCRPAGAMTMAIAPGHGQACRQWWTQAMPCAMYQRSKLRASKIVSPYFSHHLLPLFYNYFNYHISRSLGWIFGWLNGESHVPSTGPRFERLPSRWGPVKPRNRSTSDMCGSCRFHPRSCSHVFLWIWVLPKFDQKRLLLVV